MKLKPPGPGKDFDMWPFSCVTVFVLAGAFVTHALILLNEAARLVTT